LAFDGTNIWVANHGSDNLTKLRASDGELLATTPLVDHVRAVSPATGRVTNTVLTFTQPYGVAFDGHSIWVSCGNNYVIKQ
jgi:DNA-binding beta-propeller fold protein YncE